MIATEVRAERTTAEEYRAGIGAMAPLLAGLLPFGMVVGTAVAAHDTPVAGWAATWFVYGGSAHLAVLDAAGAPSGLAWGIAAALLINARLVVYSVSMGRHWRGETTPFKALMAATIVDPSFAVGDVRYRNAGPPASKRAFYIGAALTLWFGWMTAIVAGMVMGSALGARELLALAVPCCLAALIAKSLATTPGRIAAITAALVAVAGSHWPTGTGLLAAIVAGSVAALACEGEGPDGESGQTP